MSKLKRRFYKHLWFFKPLSYLSLVVLTVFLLFWLTPKLADSFRWFTSGSKLILAFIDPSIKQLDSYKNRTNFLLLGVGGGDHPGGDLTDSIMIISVNQLSGDTVLISLPRDIWIESLSAKLNTAYHFGEQKQEGGGLVLAKAAVSEIINQPIHYSVLLDFSGFEAAIDVVNGIDFNVPHGFTDSQYPIPGQETAEPETDRYETLTFVPGLQHFDGTTALKYVRSRYSQGEEGTDYARSQRQQQVILAFKNKLLSPQIFLNLSKLKSLYFIFKTAVKTDIPSSLYPDLIKIGLRLNQTNIRTGIIDQGSDSEDIPALLYHPSDNLYGQWVLLPIDNNWQAVYDHVAEILYQNQ